MPPFLIQKIVRGFRQRDAARGRELLQTGCHIDPIAKNILAFVHHITNMDAHAQLDCGMCRQTLLHGQCRLGRGHDGGELHQPAVAHALENTAAVTFRNRFEQFGPQGSEVSQGTRFIRRHQRRISDYVGGHDRLDSAAWLIIVDCHPMHSIDGAAYPKAFPLVGFVITRQVSPG